MSGFKIEGNTYLIAGVANKKSVACFIAKALIENGAKVIFTAQNDKNLASINKIFPDFPSFILDIENEKDLANLKTNCELYAQELHGFVHSMAFANFSEGPKPFHETNLKDYLQACHISSFSLVQMANEIKGLLTKDASIITISISNTYATSYGYLGPIKAMLETTVAYLAKSLSEFSNMRVNSIGAGPLKTSASAGIPDYIENYLYSEALTMRKDSLKTPEVANTALFLLSPLASGINAENIIVDCGMNANYFDQTVVKKFSE
jgi:enoyl-[acyl-carrier protein] reductase I